MQIEKIKRTIYYYHIEFKFLEDFSSEHSDPFRKIFEIIISLAKTRAHIRYQKFGEKLIFIQDISFKPEQKLIIGKLRCIRKDILPELMNTKTDEAREIEAAEEEGLLETTHFIIDYSKNKKKIAIEFNQFGAKILDFINYIQTIGVSKNAIKSLGFIPIVKNDLSKLKDRINRCSEFTVKVHKDNIEEVKNLDGNIYSALKASIDHFDNDYTELILKFDYKKRESTQKINNSIINLVKAIFQNRKNADIFNQLSIKAEDTEKNNLLENFDLLADKFRSEIKVEKKKRHKTIVSVDLFEKMQSELIKNRV